ncbi:hypothetical protein [uncultured Tenacibaculum sp.]|uniref:hypothetical protein n=1 Tax=uncultured Tenacibaculum sp. TaxID=174713 RepID=UPI00262A3193|nr:hypothetical protein [uncultured Tenacibaculum sp.]
MSKSIEEIVVKLYKKKIMKINILKPVLTLIFAAVTISVSGQNQLEKLEAYYFGFKKNGYNFSYIEEATGEKELITFNEIAPEILEEFDLKQEFFEGVNFEITYSINKVGNEYNYTVVKLKEIKETSKEVISEIQETESKPIKDKLEAHYVGYKEGVYRFSFFEEATGTKELINFQAVEIEILEEYDLKKEFFEGVYFKVFYTMSKQSDGKYLYRITNLKEIKE